MRYLSLGQQRILIVLALFLLGALYFKFYYFPPASSEKIAREIVVEVLGEVRKPGRFQSISTSTVAQAIMQPTGKAR